MKIKALPAIVIALAALIFGANLYIAHAACGDGACAGQVYLTDGHPSCQLQSKGFLFDLTSSVHIGSCIDARYGTQILTCSPGSDVCIEFGDGRRVCTNSLQALTRQTFKCQRNPYNGVDTLTIDTEQWWNQWKIPAPYQAPSKPQPAAAGLRVSPFQSASMSEAITDSALVTMAAADAGMELDPSGAPTLIVAGGQAQMELPCTGDVVTVSGPGTISIPTDTTALNYLIRIVTGQPGPLPDCTIPNLLGRWRGGYAQINGSNTVGVPLIVDITSPSGGAVETPTGKLPIIAFNSSGSYLSLRAQTASAGGSHSVQISGQVSKRGILVDVSETDTTISPPVYVYGYGYVQRLYIAENGLPAAVVNQPYNFVLSGLSPGHSPVSYSVSSGSLPAGLSLDSGKGTITGKPTAAGASSIVITATDGNGDTFSQPLTLTVKPLALTSFLLPDAYVGRPYSASLAAAGGRAPYHWSLPLYPLPSGLQLNAQTGGISGTPLQAAPGSEVVVAVSDAGGNTDVRPLSFSVRGLTIVSSHVLSDAAVGSPYEFRLQAVGNSSAVTWSMQPDPQTLGLKLDAQTGELTGVPTGPGMFSIYVTAQTDTESVTRQHILPVQGAGAVAAQFRGQM